MRPICYDFFCGLASGEPEVRSRADSFIQKTVTSRAKNPNHVALAILHLPTSIHAPELRTMRDLNHPRLAARFTRFREVRVLPVKALNNSSTECATRIIDRLNLRVAMMKCKSLSLSGLLRAAL